jgi:hypothetical protein
MLSTRILAWGQWADKSAFAVAIGGACGKLTNAVEVTQGKREIHLRFLKFLPAFSQKQNPALKKLSTFPRKLLSSAFAIKKFPGEFKKLM